MGRDRGERERDRGEREGVTGGKRKNYKHKRIHGILSCRASIRLPETTIVAMDSKEPSDWSNQNL